MSRRYIDEADACLMEGEYPFPRILALCARCRLELEEGKAGGAERALAEAEALAVRCGLEADAEAQRHIDAARTALSEAS